MQCNRDSNKLPDKIESTHKEEVPKDNVVKTSSTIKFSEPSEDVSIIPPVPKTAVQFLMTWKAYKSTELRYKYLEVRMIVAKMNFRIAWFVVWFLMKEMN